MAKNYERLSEDFKKFIEQQKMFFVGTAPSDEKDVHIAPKGYDILKIVDDSNLMYLDYYGSGNDTAGDLAGNKKITLIWCSFDKAPLILRVFGEGFIVSRGTEEFSGLMKQYFSAFKPEIIRQLFKVKITRVMTSCGYGVPLMKYEGDRETLQTQSMKKISG